MNLRRFSWCILLGLGNLLWAQPDLSGQPVDGYAAEVDGRIITVRDVIEETRQEMNDAIQSHKGDPAELVRKQEAVFQAGLSRLIDRKLMLAKFEKLGATLPAGTIRERKERILRDRFNNDRTQLLQILRRMGITEEEWEEQLRESIIEQSMLQEFVRAKIQITPAEIREAYAANAENLQSDVELNVRAIAFRPPRPGQEEDRQQTLEEVERLLESGADFAAVAREFSEGPNAHKGGDQGWVKPSTLPRPIREALEQVAVGQMTPRVDLPSQSYFFLVENRRGGEQLPLSEAQAGIENELRSQKYDALYEAFVQGLREEFPVFPYNPDISAVTGE